MESILASIKNMLGISEEITDFDTELIMHINTALAIVSQIGVGSYFSITGYNETWNDFIEDLTKLEMVKSYIYMKVRIIFDPPTSQVAEIFNKQMNEIEWRMNIIADV